jgi:nucleoside 2-deoxyribosyltransferase
MIGWFIGFFAPKVKFWTAIPRLWAVRWTAGRRNCLTDPNDRCQDVFLPNAAAHAAAKIAICGKYGIEGIAPLDDESASLPQDQAWRLIYRKDIEMMRQCDIIIANLTPFRGASADSGTLIELGWFLGQGKPVFGYSNSAEPFHARSLAYLAAIADPIPDLTVEGFGLADNLMIPGAVEYGGGLPMTLPVDRKSRAFDALDIFEACVAAAAKALGL